VAKLKVFRTAIGFHDAYVAAASRKAALEAWGSDKDLFARGAAEQVTDEALMADALAAPGKVIKRLRGTAAEQLAALPADTPKRRKVAKNSEAAVPSAPMPSRAALDKAEAAIAQAEEVHAKALAQIAAREKKLAEERRALRRKQEDELSELERQRNNAAGAYEKAMAGWRG
jgi:hypothetical protein